MVRWTILVFTVGLIGCSKEAGKPKYSQFYTVNKDIGTCLGVTLDKPTTQSGEFVPGTCPDSVEATPSKLTKIKTCPSYKDTRNQDPNTYQWTLYDKTLGEDGQQAERTAAEAEEYCTNIASSVAGTETE